MQHHPKNPEIEKLNKRLDELLVKAYIENGEVLWNARNGKFDLNQPVYRHLKEKFWKQRPLDILMQRVTQMYVIPDAIDPKIFNIPSTCLDLTLKGWNEGKPIEPGAIVPPETALELPTMNLTAFHEDVRLYTIIMADLDHPNEETQSYQQQCHWMGCNIPISMHDGNIKAENAVLPYIPPHPAKGTKRHRYVFLVMQQGEKGQVRLENVKLDRAVHLRTLASELSLRPVGVSFFRSEWNETVDEVYRQHLGLEPPVYGPAPAATRFDEGTVGSQKKAFGKYANA
ncbi:mitochondrial 54S ribosomal protein YmL35 [Mycoemilia scoparia]|uniref:Mitochondrial 54S ribosomal protein YmL35 n=1 Tax=Mycoemilia scoparia TaxID=417184 RepID=A0A9W7ZXT5_9FUNG|nr:mitochondrial 54S ribosomal protein YmL35 [Mycoemilia scoparia]